MKLRWKRGRLQQVVRTEAHSTYGKVEFRPVYENVPVVCDKCEKELTCKQMSTGVLCAKCHNEQIDRELAEKRERGAQP